MIQPTTMDAYKLLHDGSIVMADMEANGIRVDVAYIGRTMSKLDTRITQLSNALTSHKIYKRWRKHFGDKTKLGSRSQLAELLFDVLGFDSAGVTDTGRFRADADALEFVDSDFVRQYLEVEKLKKVRSTYLNNINNERVGEFIHPNFMLNLVRTFRGSSDHPNFTNMPVRDELSKKLIRRAFIARKGHRIVDLDFKGSEVNAAAWYHKDPVMLEYIKTNPGRMHFDAAMDAYMLPEHEMTDKIRYCGKNKFVFPQFYGDWWWSCARSLWLAIDQLKLETKSGIPLKKWLARKGIKCLGSGNPDNIKPGSFEEHLKNVEDEFWNERFRVYKQWKDEWWEAYQTNGYFQMLSGFVVTGYLNRKNVINYPVQGTAFHCLLWCLIEIRRLLRKHKMKTKLIGQIHDDVVSDTPEDEIDDYVGMARHVIQKSLKRHWPFIITPMRVDVEATPVDGSWYEKREYVSR